MNRFRAGLATLVAIGLLGVTGAAPGAFAASEEILPPDADPFYEPPPQLKSFRRGEVLRDRTVTISGVSNASAAYQLMYRTTDAKGKPIASVTTFALPKEPAPGPPNLVSMHHAYDSLTLKCAPSHSLRTGQVTGLGDAGISTNISGILDYGWVVSMPDYEGLESQWTVGPLQGRTALDGIRAVENFAAAGLDSRTHVAMAGYSGGAIPTVRAASLAPKYAPELNIVAAAAGGNLPDPIQNLAPLNGSPLFGTVIGVAIGVDRAYPGLRLEEMLNEKGKALAARSGSDADGCAGSVTNAPFGTVAEYSNYPTPEALLALPRVRRVFSRMNLIVRPAPKTSSLIFNAAQDELTIKAPVDQLVAEWCDQGSTIKYSTPPGDHITGSDMFGDEAIPYIEDRFEGEPAPENCPA